MGPGDVVLFLVAAVVGLRWVATAAVAGPSALVVWVLAFAAFFVPLAVTVVELTARYPDEGGLYVWVKRAFGDFAGVSTTLRLAAAFALASVPPDFWVAPHISATARENCGASTGPAREHGLAPTAADRPPRRPNISELVEGGLNAGLTVPVPVAY